MVSSSLLTTLKSNSFHVLEEAIPPDKGNLEEDVPPMDNFDTKVELDVECESPITPDTSNMVFLPEDLPTLKHSKKQLKKAAKAARNRASSH